MQGKVDLLNVGGGDRVQIENTAAELRKLNVDVDIIPGFKVDYSQYDLVHLFQLDWTPETYLYARNAKKSGKPLVLSPIHHNINELIKFDTQYTFDFRSLSKVVFKDQFKRDTLKNIYKCFFDSRKIYPTAVSMLIGLRNMQKKALILADKVLVQTEEEAKDLTEAYEVDIAWVKIPNGVGSHFLNVDSSSNFANPLPFEDYILCVGRVEARKNQLNIVDAVRLLRSETNKDLKLVFVGRKSSKRHFAYIKRFDKIVKQENWITYLSEFPYEKMPAIYKHAKVCVSASWFETTGLTSLEALFCGTNAVASGTRAREYLGNYVSYCLPDDISSIADAIKKELVAPRPQIDSTLKKEYTWENAARKTFAVYQDLL